MPYIDQEARDRLNNNFTPRTPGELNYMLTSMAMMYLRDKTLYPGAFNYTFLNDVIGAFESAKQEFYRRVVVPYEDKKLAENGDVYGV